MRSFITSIAVFAALIGHPAVAGEVIPEAPTMRIEADEAHKAFLFVIDGEPVALLDKGGLHVRDSIEYGGTLTDSGTASFDKRLEEFGTEGADEN